VKAYKIVWTDLVKIAVAALGPKAADLEYAVTFQAKSQKDAERIAKESGADKIGAYRVEPA